MQVGNETRIVVVFTEITTLEQLAQTDQLTGAVNRRALELVLEKEISKAKRHDYPLSIIYFDVDHFKRVNDRYGHPAGDRVLIRLVGLMQSRLRESDMLARWGGEEFLVLLSYTDLADAVRIAEELRLLVEHASFAEPEHVTCSFGVASLHKDDTQERLVKRGDEALYRAKAAGRNRVTQG
jgi:diguanylate cyclase (GGDEF)-like protein